jgi:RNA polymerase-binding transcription factor DksA
MAAKKKSAKAAKKTTKKVKPVSKKKAAKPAKKAAPKKAKKKVVKKAAVKKKVAKPSKKVAKKAAKKAAVKKKSKKAAPKKATKVVKKATKPAKKAETKKAPKEKEIKVEVESTPVKKEKPIKKKALKKATGELKNTKTLTPSTPAPKPAPPELTVFNVPTQRPIAHKPTNPSSTPNDKTRYSDSELKEFEALINQKLEKARGEYKILKETLNRNNDSGTDSTSGGNTKVLEDGAETAEKENLSQLAARQQKYIANLENALVRIKNGTYGICSVTGKLIPKERLIAVPHTTQSIEGKLMQKD